MTIQRPDWNDLYKDCVGGGERPNELVLVTRETLRLAQLPLRKMNENDYYHNNGAAEREIMETLQMKDADSVALSFVQDDWRRAKIEGLREGQRDAGAGGKRSRDNLARALKLSRYDLALAEQARIEAYDDIAEKLGTYIADYEKLLGK
jgi:hypothetical protein